MNTPDEERIFNMSWARENIRGFRKYNDKVILIKKDEQRYRDIPGYEPKLYE